MTKKEKIRGKGWTGYDGGEHPTAKKIVQLTRGNKAVNVWDSMSHASEHMHIEIGNICKCCQGKRKTAGKFKWEYKHPTLQKVHKWSLDCLKLQSYNTIVVAAALNNLKEKDILSCAMGKQAIAGGFIWKF